MIYRVDIELTALKCVIKTEKYLYKRKYVHDKDKNAHMIKTLIAKFKLLYY